MKGTRKERAIALYQRVRRGPASVADGVGPGVLTYLSSDERKKLEEALRTSYRVWVESWILDDLVTLIPELRKGVNAGVK